MAQAAGMGSVLFAGLIGLVSVGTFVATLTLVNRKPQSNPLPPFVPLTPERRRLVLSIDARSSDLQRGLKLTGITFRGDHLEARRLGHEQYSVKVGKKKYEYPYSQDAAAHFVALDATRISAAA